MYNVKLEQFEGPMDLLLELITREELDATEISLAQVTNQYLSYLENKDKIELSNLADFLTVASKLILIKSKSLLPLLILSDEEEEEIVDLEQQIKEYKKFKEASVSLGELAEANRQMFSRDSFLEAKPIFFPPEKLEAVDLRDVYQNILSEIPVMEEIKEERVKKVISLKKKINNLQKMLKEKVEISFNEIVEHSENQAEVVVSFLAILEMIKRRVIIAEQAEKFCDIKISLEK